MKAIVRTGIVSVVLSAAILLGFWRILRDDRARQVAELEALNAQMAATLAEKEAMLDRLGRARRIAHVDILGQEFDDRSEPARTTLRFIELDDDGAEIARQTFVIPGSVLFIDTWTAKFRSEDVAVGHPLRGRTLVLLRRIYSELLAPRDGFAIDTPGAVPAGYAASDPARFEQMVWEQFWQIATDPEIAARMGVRVAQGEVVYIPVKAGQSFEFVVDAAGGINLTPRTLDRALTAHDEER